MPTTYTHRGLKEQTEITYRKFPSAVIWNAEDIDNRDIGGRRLFGRLIARLGYLDNLFILERLISKQGHSNGQEVLDVGREMLHLTINAFKHQDRFHGIQSDFEWIVSYAMVKQGSLWRANLN